MIAVNRGLNRYELQALGLAFRQALGGARRDSTPPPALLIVTRDLRPAAHENSGWCVVDRLYVRVDLLF